MKFFSFHKPAAQKAKTTSTAQAPALKISIIKTNVDSDNEEDRNPSEELKRESNSQTTSKSSKDSWATGSATSALSESPRSSLHEHESRPQFSIRKSLFFEAINNSANAANGSPLPFAAPNDSSIPIIPTEINTAFTGGKPRLSIMTTQEAHNKYQLVQFFREKILCTQGNAMRYTEMLATQGVSSCESLTDRLNSDADFLLNIGFDEYDAQEIREYLVTAKNTNQNQRSKKGLFHCDSNLSAISDASAFYTSSYGGSPVSQAATPRAGAEANRMPASDVAKLYYDASQCNAYPALEMLKEQAADGHLLAQAFLMRMYAIGQGAIKKDVNKAQAIADNVYPYLYETVIRKDIDKMTLMYARYLIGLCMSEGLATQQNHNEALIWYSLSADHGYAAAQAYLGTCYYDGIGVAVDYTEAARWYKLAAEQGFASAQCNLGLCYEQGHGVFKSNIEAVKWYRLGANQGHDASRYNLGYCFEKGIGVEKNVDEAMHLYIESAERGYAPAQYILGNFFSTGKYKISQDLGQSFQWYLKSAENGHPVGQYKIGIAYETGVGVEVNLEESLLWYRKSARQGHVPSKIKVVLLSALVEGSSNASNSSGLLTESTDNSDRYEELLRSFAATGHICASPREFSPAQSQSSGSAASTPRSTGSQYSMDVDEVEMMPLGKAIYELGICYEKGCGVEADYDTAIQWYTVSATDGDHADSQFRLGLYHELGTNGAEKDICQALQWYRQAAQHGHAVAQYKIGICYEKGHATIEKNENFAITFYKQSAEQGYAPAQHQLGLCYFNGIGGLKKSTKEAVRWYQLAAEQGFPPAMNSLAYCYFHGRYLTKNLKIAIKLYKLAADSGYVVALNNLGYCYLHGLGVQKNDVMAFRMFKIAGKLGYAPAQNNVGNCYFSGVGVDKNLQLAFGWYKLSAEQDHSTAQYNLGYCYEKGYGDRVKLNEAIKCYHEAALKGHRKANIAIRKFSKTMISKESVPAM